MSESKLEIVRGLFDRFGDGDLENALTLVSEDFVAVVPPSMSAEPDVYEGHAGARRYFQAFEGLMEDVRFEALELFEEGGAVIVRMRLAGRGAASGIEVEQHAAVVNWVEHGKVTRMEPQPDLETARKVARGGTPPAN
jgi:ketosteroid isomerase-like protein